MAWGPFLVLDPVLARAYLGGAGPWGAILACYGAGAVAGGLVAFPQRRRCTSTVPRTTLGARPFLGAGMCHWPYTSCLPSIGCQILPNEDRKEVQFPWSDGSLHILPAHRPAVAAASL